MLFPCRCNTRISNAASDPTIRPPQIEEAKPYWWVRFQSATRVRITAALTTAAFPRLMLGLLVVVAAVWLAFNRGRLDAAQIESAIHGLGLLAPLGHILLFAVGTILFVPGAIFGLVGGALFGPLWGAVLNLIGATLGATA